VVQVSEFAKYLNVMSAYGAVTVTNRPIGLLPPTTWDLPKPAPGKPAAPFRRLVLHHLRLESARALPGPAGTGPSLNLLEYTYRIFAAEVEAGRTYPQEADALAAGAGASASGGGSLGGESDADDLLSGGGGGGDGSTHTHATTRAYTRAAFEAYFWAADVIVAIGQTDDDAAVDGGSQAQAQAQNVGSGDLLELSRGGRSWEDALVGFYYVKPNYPGRSSHVSGFFLRSLLPLPILFHTRRSVTHDGLGRFVMQALLFHLPIGNSDMERLWASRTCITVLRSDTKQAFSIWFMQIIQEV
jgi:hypothetical protein